MKITKETTVKEIKRALKALGDMEVLTIEGWGKVQNIFGRYAVCKGEDDSDPLTDYSAWCYGWKQTHIAETVIADMQ